MALTPDSPWAQGCFGNLRKSDRTTESTIRGPLDWGGTNVHLAPRTWRRPTRVFDRVAPRLEHREAGRAYRLKDSPLAGLGVYG